MPGVLGQAIQRARHRRLLRRMAGPRLLRAYAEARPDAPWIEVGANDGVQHDHLRPLLVDGLLGRGVMVEPAPAPFARLQEHYAGVERVALERAVVAELDGPVEFWHLRDPRPGETGLPDWYDGIGSRSRAHLEAHADRVPGLEDRLVRAVLPGLTFASLCAKHGIDEVGLLVVDAEGGDWDVLRGIDLAAHRLQLVVWEHFHLRPADRAAARAHLEAHGFAVMEEGFDSFAVHRDAPVAGHDLRPAVPGVSAHGA